MACCRFSNCFWTAAPAALTGRKMCSHTQEHARPKRPGSSSLWQGPFSVDSCGSVLPVTDADWLQAASISFFSAANRATERPPLQLQLSLSLPIPPKGLTPPPRFHPARFPFTLSFPPLASFVLTSYSLIHFTAVHPRGASLNQLYSLWLFSPLQPSSQLAPSHGFGSVMIIW